MRHPLRLTATRIAGFVGLVSAAALSLFSVALQAQISDAAKKQIVEITAFKKTFTAAEQKMSFNLVLLSRQSRGQLPKSLQSLIDFSQVDAAGRPIVLVDGYAGPSLLANTAMRGVETVDGHIPTPAISAGKLRAHVETQDLLSLASSPDVKQLRDPERFVTNVGAVTSQGYISHGANKVFAAGVTGAGVRVGVLSDSASAARVSALIATGDLPADTIVLPNQAGSGGEDEGTAMMEIVHDIAPNAKLLFATGGPTQAQFAANIRSLRYDYHCDIIVDDISYYSESAFQDDTIALAVNDVTANGAMYFSSAANSGNLTSGTSGTWEGDFTPGQTAAGLLDGDGTLHNFGTAANPMYSDTLKAASSYITLKWSDPIGGSSNDYDLYVLDAAGTSIIKASTSSQTGTQNPYEAVSGTFPAGSQVVVVLYSGVQRALRVDTNRGQLNIATSGSTYGHNAAASTFSMAAVYWNSAHTGAKAFTGGTANPIETFSSDGPRKIFYTPDGLEITPGNLLFSTNGGTTLQKPDATAADGVVTKTPGFNPFFGTSAAAPHAAGVAALIKSANPSLTPAQIKSIMLSTSLDTMALGVDRDSGYGILAAVPAVNAAQAVTSAQ